MALHDENWNNGRFAYDPAFMKDFSSLEHKVSHALGRLNTIMPEERQFNVVTLKDEEHETVQIELASYIIGEIVYHKPEPLVGLVFEVYDFFARLINKKLPEDIDGAFFDKGTHYILTYSPPGYNGVDLDGFIFYGEQPFGFKVWAEKL